MSSRTSAVVAIGGTVYPVEQVIADPLSPWIFVKVTAQNLPVMPFDRSDQPVVGELVHGLLGGATFYTSVLTNLTDRSVTERRELVRSTELFTARYQLLVPPLSGSAGDPLVNNQGQVIGVLTTAGDHVSILPLSQISRQIENVLRDRTIPRVKFGAQYVLIDELWRPTKTEEDGGLKRGALIYRNSALGFIGVTPRWPAASAGVKAGDVIVKVDGEEVSIARDLTEIIQSHAPDTEITLTIWRAGETITLPVTLAAWTQ